MERRTFSLGVLGLAFFVLAGCSGVEMKKGEKKRAGRDTPHGPGVLSGKDGEFVLFRVEDEPEGAKEEEAE